MSEEIKVGDRVRLLVHLDPPSAVVLWVDERDLLVQLEKSNTRQVWPRGATLLLPLLPRTITFEVTLPLEEAQKLDNYWYYTIHNGSGAVGSIRKSLQEALKKAETQ